MAQAQKHRTQLGPGNSALDRQVDRHRAEGRDALGSRGVDGDRRHPGHSPLVKAAKRAISGSLPGKGSFLPRGRVSHDNLGLGLKALVRPGVADQTPGPEEEGGRGSGSGDGWWRAGRSL